ncbi:putative non-specific serine/threonine protein kinase [Helianthus anomalus]
MIEKGIFICLVNLVILFFFAIVKRDGDSTLTRIRFGPINGETHLITQVMGTYGYAAPKYVATGYFNGKNDIYAFGVVLLETLMGLQVLTKRGQKTSKMLCNGRGRCYPRKRS